MAERDVMLGDLLEWLRVGVIPSLGLLERIGEEKGFDIYEILRKAPKPTELSKKQERLLVNSQSLSAKVVKHYLDEFLSEED